MEDSVQLSDSEMRMDLEKIKGVAQVEASLVQDSLPALERTHMMVSVGPTGHREWPTARGLFAQEMQGQGHTRASPKGHKMDASICVLSPPEWALLHAAVHPSNPSSVIL